MNLLYLCHRVPFPPHKGEKIRTFNIVRYLIKSGYNLTICTPIEGKVDYEYISNLKNQVDVTVHSAPKPGISRWVKGLIKNQPLSVANFYSNELQHKIDTILESQSIDVILCTSSAMAEYVFKSKVLQTDKSTTRLIMDFMDLDSDKWRQYTSLKPFPLSEIYRREAKLLSRYEKRIHRAFDACIFISKSEMDMFLSHEKDLGKLSVVSNCLDTDFFCPPSTPIVKGDDAAYPSILFTGVMDYFPNVDAVTWFVDDIWPEIKQKWPQAEFVIAGMNPNDKIIEYGKQDGIEVTGFVDDILQYYYKADIFVAPFKIARGVQTKVLQSFACGLPVISSPIAIEGIDCNNQVHLLVAKDKEGFIRNIDMLLQDQELQTRIRSNAIKLINSCYSWTACLKKLDDVIKNCQG